ncbi:hypothetical protein XELAEV_18030215mg [Xenopus laevis]|uniref:Uncharacterized protein n=1 Tax=Xenopus laevis TaxID=8355 RepID=A0A974CTB7_XENLA|nr:hypothetical protein XELAEV_18030215mg [Xenopus laevis]
MIHLFLDRQGSEIKFECTVDEIPYFNTPGVLGNSCYPCTHTSVSSHLHHFDMDITVTARIVLWQDGYCPGLHLPSCVYGAYCEISKIQYYTYLSPFILHSFLHSFFGKYNFGTKQH